MPTSLQPSLQPGDIRYSGYPITHVLAFGRSREGGLRLDKVKHLLWGDWVTVADHDAESEGARLDRPVTPAERAKARELVEGLIPVTVRGARGFMKPQDLGEERLLELVFVDVGQGDGAVMVTPDDRRYVIDAGVSDNMYRYLRWRFRGFEDAHTDFTGLIVTHPDKDHYYGFRELIEDSAVRADHIWHNGLVERFGLKPNGSQSTSANDLLGRRVESNGQDYLVDLEETDDELRVFLEEGRNWVKDSSGRPKLYPALLAAAMAAQDEAGARRFPDISMMSTAHGETVGGATYLPGFAPGNASGCTIQVLGPVVEPGAGGEPRLRTFSDSTRARTTGMKADKTKNGHSILLKLTYRDLTLLLGGDLNRPAEAFLLRHYTGLQIGGAGAADDADIAASARGVFGADIAKACHHGSADFMDVFMAGVNAAATIVSSGDEESHAHPRSDTLGALGRNGHGRRALVFSTELARSTPEFTDREDSPWYKAAMLDAEARTTTDPDERLSLEGRARALMEQQRKRNVTVYGSINLRSDGRRVVIGYMLEKPSRGKRWDIYELVPGDDGRLVFEPKS